MSSPQAIVTIHQNHVYTTSLMVAEKFNKNHRDVLRAIRKLDVFTEFNGLNFEPVKDFTKRNFALSEYTDPTGRKLPMYMLTRQGFTMTAMSFTGREAALWKIAYINAFDRMEAKLRELGDTEHRALISGLYGKHPQWRETADLITHGFNNREIASLQGKHIRNVQKMVARMKEAGLHLVAQHQAG